MGRPEPEPVFVLFHSNEVLMKHCFLIRFCNIFDDNHCNQLEKWLSDRNYKQKLVREQILKARAISRENCLIMKETLRLRIGWYLI